MNRIVFGRWTLDADPAATRTVYSNITHGSTEDCGCDPCLNFAASRDAAYPAEFRRLLDDLGIQFDCEAEVYYNAHLGSGVHSYGGWFHFIGLIVSGADALVDIGEDFGTFDLHSITEQFAAGVTHRPALVDQAFDSHSVIQLEFTAEIQWVIDAPPPP